MRPDWCRIRVGRRAPELDRQDLFLPAQLLVCHLRQVVEPPLCLGVLFCKVGHPSTRCWDGEVQGVGLLAPAGRMCESHQPRWKGSPAGSGRGKGTAKVVATRAASPGHGSGAWPCGGPACVPALDEDLTCRGSGARTGWSHVPASHSKGRVACGTQPRVLWPKRPCPGGHGSCSFSPSQPFRGGDVEAFCSRSGVERGPCHGRQLVPRSPRP